MALVITPYLFQTLGEEQYGLVSLGLTVILLFGILVNYGFGLNVPKSLAQLKNDALAKENLINEVIVTRLSVCFVLLLLIYLFTQHLGWFSGYSTILIFSAIQLLNDALFPMFILQGFDRLSWISKANAASKLLYLGIIIIAVKEIGDAKWVNFILGGTGALVNGFLLVMIYRAEAIKFHWVGFQRIRLRILDNFQFFSSTVASYILINGGFILLSNFVTNSELGFYALAQRVSVLLRMVPVFLTQSILQSATRLYDEDEILFEKYLMKSYKNGLLITFAIGVTFAVSATWVVRWLAGEFVPLSASLMRILSFLPFIGMFNIPNIIRMLVMDQKHILAKAIWSTTIFMLVIGTIGSYFFGGYGLAWALVISELFNFWVHHFFLTKQKKLLISAK